MFRELMQIVLAIHLSANKLPDKRTEELAVAIQKNADFAGIDPLLEVAIITHESEWGENKISADGEDYGLLQIRGRYYSGKNTWLLWGENNIRVGSYIMKKDIEFCEKHLKRSPETKEWLSLYTGECKNSLCWCHPTTIAKQFSSYAECLQTAVENGSDEESFECKKIYGRK